ncbi:MAG: hypothetical protein JWO15_3622 [Sphingomonadales bacterium]|nr:hypothetical protein [Sphingomonadales bacterium]
MSDQVTIALKQVHIRIDEIKDEVLAMSDDLSNVEKLQSKLQNTISAVVAEGQETAQLTKQVLENSQGVNERLSNIEAGHQRQTLILWVVLAFTLGGITIPLLYALISKL